MLAKNKTFLFYFFKTSCFQDNMVYMGTRGRGRAQAPDKTLGGSSGTISSSSLNQWKDVSFFTFATWAANTVVLVPGRLRDSRSRRFQTLPCRPASRCNAQWPWNTNTLRNEDLKEEWVHKHNNYITIEKEISERWCEMLAPCFLMYSFLWNSASFRAALNTETAEKAQCYSLILQRI